MSKHWFVLYGLAVVVLLVFGVALLRHDPATKHAISTSSIVDKRADIAHASERLVPLGPYYLQGDPRWGKQKLGGSDDRLVDSGCTISCVAMALSQKGYRIDPGALNRRLHRMRGFTKRGWLIWSSIKRLTKGRHKAVVIGRPSHTRIRRLLKRGHGVIAKIRLYGWQQHWVWIVGRKGRDYLVKDPLESSKKLRWLSSYKSPIYAMRWIE